MADDDLHGHRFAQVFQALASRSRKYSFFSKGLSGNKVAAAMLLLASMYIH